MTSSSIVANKDFSERMFERIKESMGDLMTETELKAILERAIEEAFFKERTVNLGYSRSEQQPSRFVELTRELMTAEVKKQVDAYFTEHADDIKDRIAEVLQEGIGLAVLRAITAQMQAPIMALENALRQRNLL